MAKKKPTPDLNPFGPQRWKVARKLVAANYKKRGISSPPILSTDDRKTFMKLLPTFQEFTKSMSLTAGLLFAGSLTFIGIVSPHRRLLETNTLGWGWIMLGLSVIAQMAIYFVILALQISHSRAHPVEPGYWDKDHTEDELMDLLGLAVTFKNQQRTLIGLMIAQTALVAAAGFQFASFVTANLSL